MTERVEEDEREGGGQPPAALRMFGEADAAACAGDSCVIPTAPARQT